MRFVPALAPLVAAALGGAEDVIPDHVLVHRLLADRCIGCHGPERSDAGLRFDRLSDLALLITPGKPERSRLIDMVRLPPGDPMLMPPPATRRRLDAGEVQLLVRWIAQGATPPAER